MTTIGLTAFIDVHAKVSLKTGAALTSEVSSVVLAVRLCRASGRVDALINVNAVYTNIFKAVQTAASEATCYICAMNITTARPSRCLALIYVFTIRYI